VVHQQRKVMEKVKRIFSVLALVTLTIGLSCKKKTPEVMLENLPFHPLESERDLDLLVNAIGDARIVLLGEASHGTTEYYKWRAAISKRLIREKGFDMIGAEAEWADSYRVNQFVSGPLKDSLQATALLHQYDRWPTWMWGNYEIASLVTWMNQHNQDQASNKVGFYGLDVYCLWESMQELAPYLRNNDSLRGIAQQVENCFLPYSADPGEYAYAVATASANCRSQTNRLWESILASTGGRTAKDEAEFVMQQNALVALNGERYYRASVTDYGGSWNIRDQHMMQTIKRLLELRGPESKLIIWAHNTHIGDARYTDMKAQGMVNIGQLVREEYGKENVYAVGFGSYEGTVTAAYNWGGTVETMNVPPAKSGSWEHQLHRISADDKILLSSEIAGVAGINQSIGHRAIGVQYNPNSERGNYVPSIMASRYDAFVYIDKTTALKPLKIQPRNEPPDTYPSGY
jgi:erythromycin esterase